MLIIRGPIKPYIFWIKIILAISLAKTRPDKTIFSALTNPTIDFDWSKELSKIQMQNPQCLLCLVFNIFLFLSISHTLRSIFQEMISMDTLIVQIMNQAQKLVSADRFLLSPVGFAMRILGNQNISHPELLSSLLTRRRTSCTRGNMRPRSPDLVLHKKC